MENSVSTQTQTAPPAAAAQPTESTQQQQLAVINHEETEGQLLAKWNNHARVMCSNLTNSDDEQRPWISRLYATADKSGLQITGEEYRIVAFVAHEVELLDRKTGELKKSIRIACLTEDGKVISSCSKSYASGMSTVMYGRKAGWFNPPIHIRVQSIKGQAGFDYISVYEVGKLPGKTNGQKRQ